MKKAIAGASAAIMALAMSGTAFAATTVTDNSDLTMRLRQRINSTITLNQAAMVDNTVAAGSSTGSNAIVSGDGAEKVSIVTGQSDAGAASETAANNAELDYSAAMDTAATPTLGPDGEVSDDSSATFSDRQREDHNSNEAQMSAVGNNVGTSASSGSNVVQTADNLEEAHVTTGTGTTASVVTTSLNNILKSLSLYIVRR